MLIVDQHLIELPVEPIADDPQRQVVVLVQKSRRGRLAGALLDHLPESGQISDVAPEVLGALALSGGPHDQAAPFRAQFLEGLAQAVSLFLFSDPP